MKESQINEVSDLFEKIRGSWACVWSYSVSHGELTLRVVGENKNENLHIIFTECRYVKFLPSWKNLNIRLSKTECDSYESYEVEDTNANFHIICSYINYIKNVEPIFRVPN